MHSLGLYGRPTGNESWMLDLTYIGRGWRRSTRSIGGYWLGSFTIHAADVTRAMMSHFYHNNLGCVVREHTAGVVTWEGYVVGMRQLLGGMEHMRSLVPEWFHNKVRARYTWNGVVDTEAGGAYGWDPDAPNDSFKDESQDFSDWETDPAGPDNAAFRIVVTCTDGSILWGFLGLCFTTVNTNDSIYIYETEDLSDEGWAVQRIPGGRASKVVSSYTIELIEGVGAPTDTAWTENTDSIGEYGEMQYIETLGSTPSESAEEVRDRHLTEFAWPRSRLVGSAAIGGQIPDDRLVVQVAGFIHSMNWRYLTTSRVATAYAMISYLIGLSEFVTAGRIELNEWAAKADCDPIHQRLADLCEQVINLGDASGNVWHGGVYAGKKFQYEPGPTTVTHSLQDGILTNALGTPPVWSSLVTPGFLLRVSSVMPSARPPGSSDVWDEPQVAYVNEVEFIAPDRLAMRLEGAETSLVVLLEQMRMMGLMTEAPRLISGDWRP